MLNELLALFLPPVLHEVIISYLSRIHRDFLVGGDLGLVIRYKKHFDPLFVADICNQYGINIHACHPLKDPNVVPDTIPHRIKEYERYVIKYKHYVAYPHLLHRMSNTYAWFYAILYNDLILLKTLPDLSYTYSNLYAMKPETLDVLYERTDDKQGFCYLIMNNSRHFKWAHERLKQLHLPLPPRIDFLSLDSLPFASKPQSLSRFALMNTFDDFLKAYTLFPHASIRGITRIAAIKNDIQWFDYLYSLDPELHPEHKEWQNDPDICNPTKHLEDCLERAKSYAMRKRICDLLHIPYQPSKEDILYYDNIFWFKRNQTLSYRMMVLCKSTALQQMLFDQGKQYMFRKWLQLPVRRSKRIQERDRERLKKHKIQITLETQK